MSITNYKAGYSGSTTGAKSGQLYRFSAGDEIPAPKGEFDHDPQITETAAKKKKSGDKPTKSNTVEEIQDYLKENEIDFDSNAKKAELLDLV